jgi:hypothetical protein
MPHSVLVSRQNVTPVGTSTQELLAATSLLCVEGVALTSSAVSFEEDATKRQCLHSRPQPLSDCGAAGAGNLIKQARIEFY